MALALARHELLPFFFFFCPLAKISITRYEEDISDKKIVLRTIPALENLYAQAKVKDNVYKERIL